MATATAHPKFNLIASEHVVSAKVYDPSGKEIGEIDHLMIDKISGQALYAVVNFCGFMCLRPGHHPTQQQLEAALEFSDDSWSDRDWEMRVHQHYSARPYWEESAAL